MKKFEFLDLAIKDFGKSVKTTEEGHQIRCNFNQNSKHLLHTEQKQLNSLVDLVLNLSLEQQRQFEIINTKLKILEEEISIQKRVLKEVKENLGYLKTQNNQIIVQEKDLLKEARKNQFNELEKINKGVQEIKQIVLS